MHIPRLPDWLVYTTIAITLLILAQERQERADAPEAPPPVPGATDVPLAPSSPFTPAHIMPLVARRETASGTAFSVGEGGVWVTARHVLDGCYQSAIVVAEGRGVAASVRLLDGDIAILTTVGGAPALPLAGPEEPQRGDTAFHLGFPQGYPGEAASRLLGRRKLRERTREATPQALIAWSEIGRTESIKGDLAGLSGAPALDAGGAVVGVTLGEGPRRGRIYTTTAATLRHALKAAKVPFPAATGSAGQIITTDNYGRVADTLRRDLGVAQVVCLAT